MRKSTSYYHNLKTQFNKDTTASSSRQLTHAESRWWIRHRSVNLFQKILFTQMVMVLTGTTMGFALSAQLTESGHLNLFAFISLILVAVVLSGGISFFMLRRAFHPFRELQQVLSKIHDGYPRAQATLGSISDPDIKHFSNALNQMLTRLDENARVIQEDQHQLQLMTARVINAQENERKRIARELHDEASQSLTAMIMGLESARTVAENENNAALEAKLTVLKELAASTLEELRKLALDLRPTMLDDLGLIPAVRWCARQGSEAAGFEFKFELDNITENERLAPELETCLFRIAQESLTNIIKYANATQVMIRLGRKESGEIFMSVLDNGCGFDRSEARIRAYNGGHLGLFDIEERAALLGGHVKIISHKGDNSGTCIYISIPATKHE